jgi:hypothetical protein
MYYFSFIDHSLSFKNNLNKQAFKFLQANNRKVTAEKDVELFKTAIKSGIEDLNKAHPRCTPINIEWWQPGFNNLRDSDWSLNLGFCTFVLYKSTN